MSKEDEFTCTRCKSGRVLSMSSKSSDMNYAKVGATGRDHDGYVPSKYNIGGGDYIELMLCLDCGQQQGTWPAERNELLEDK